MNQQITCLIDTNILIQFEEEDHTGRLKKKFAEVFGLCQKHGIILFHHKASIDDINRDNNEYRKEKTLSTLDKYPQLESPPMATVSELESLFGGICSDNDHVDCLILFALYKNCIDFVITEDSGIHRRGSKEKVNLKDRIFSIDDLRMWITRNFEPNKVELPHVKDVLVYTLNQKDPIFNSLRDVYTNKDGFDNWFIKCCKEQRRAWVIFNSKNSGLVGSQWNAENQ